VTNDIRTIKTRIPEGHRVPGLEYGAHVSREGWAGNYVRPEGTEEWVTARRTPADDELVGDDAAVLAAIEDEVASVEDEDVAPYADEDEVRS